MLTLIFVRSFSKLGCKLSKTNVAHSNHERFFLPVADRRFIHDLEPYFHGAIDGPDNTESYQVTYISGLTNTYLSLLLSSALTLSLRSLSALSCVIVLLHVNH